MSQTLHYLESLVKIPSPTGYTYGVQNYLMETLSNMGYTPLKTAKGMVIVTVKGENDDYQRVITAHVDTLGAIVRAVKSDGRLKLDKIGGFPWNMIEGENCTIHMANHNKTTTGTILIHQTSTHVYRDAGSAERTQDNMEVRLDERVTSESETRELGIEVGDFVSFDPRYEQTETGFIKSRFLDDKVSAAILLNTLEKIQNEQLTLPFTTHFAFSTNEEIGYGFNSTISEKVVEYLALDMGAIGDDQQTDEYSVSICVKDASGPYHFNFRQHLVQLAKDNGIDYRLDIYPYYGSDASAAMRAGAEVKHALIGAGIESSHSYERTHMTSIEATEQLVQIYLLSGAVTDETL
ncbi:M42 family metallopeptidase [Carnobacteriaceae bacterium zg-ZUI252]|nr:M42 family metallopeptidase [Carnobacteriaceae bacterium zg-ZUI252]